MCFWKRKVWGAVVSGKLGGDAPFPHKGAILSHNRSDLSVPNNKVVKSLISGNATARPQLPPAKPGRCLGWKVLVSQRTCYLIGDYSIFTAVEKERRLLEFLPPVPT